MTDTTGGARKNAPSLARRGRDHLNLAEFPISVLQRQQPADDGGRKLDTVSFRASRYDRQSGRRLPQTVTLTTNSRSGLPTPADENVVLALLYLTLRQGDFRDPKVHFSPWQLFGVMGWSKNGRSYARLRDVLRRLKSLTIVYENAWWDNAGRKFEEEFATGIVSAYKIVQQTAGRKGEGSVPTSWVLWNPDFFESLAAGSLKRLNLEQLFALSRPTAQRMYRFLDKHFYHSEALEFDLREFACGHLGLAESYDTGQLKTKLRPALAELEQIGFIRPADPAQRFRKIKPGLWRIAFHRAEQSSQPPPSAQQPDDPAPSLRSRLIDQGITPRTASRLVRRHSASLIRSKLDVFHWLSRRNDPSISQNPAGYLVRSIQEDYAPPRRYRTEKRRQAERNRRWQHEKQHDAAIARQQAERRRFKERWLPQWNQLPQSEQRRIRDALTGDNPLLSRAPNILQFRCLQRLAEESETGNRGESDPRSAAA